MNFISTKFDLVYLIEPKVFEDSRGYFLESFNKRVFFENTGLNIDFVQDNEAYSRVGTVRGLHYQLPPMAQSKLVRVIEGRILDVIVDIRQGSPTFGEHLSIELDSENARQLFVPRGFAHGYSVLSNTAVMTYKVDNFYSKEFERGILYKDPSINIDWHLETYLLSVSEKDSKQPNLDSADLFNYEENLYA